MKVRVILFAAAAMMAAPSYGQQTPESEAKAEKPAKPPKAKKICRKQGSTGSRMSPSICLTQEEWDVRDASPTPQGPPSPGLLH